MVLVGVLLWIFGVVICLPVGLWRIAVGAYRRQGETALQGVGLIVMGLASVFFGMVFGPRPGFRDRSQGQLTACKSNLKNLGTALEMYSTDWEGHYPSSLQAVTPNYLKTIPECPAAGTMTYRAAFGPKAPLNPDNHLEDYYYLECYGQNHSQVGVTGNYPAYNGIEGLIEREPGPPYRTRLGR